MSERDPNQGDRDVGDRNVDARIRAAFGEPPDFEQIVTAARPTPRAPVWRWITLLAAAALLAITAVLAWPFGSDSIPEEANVVDAAAVWQELNPNANCMAPRITRPDELAQHCQVIHGSEVRIDVSSTATVHGPTTCSSLPGASVLTVIYPAGPGQLAEVRTILIGAGVPVRSSESVRAFPKELRGVGVIELTTAPAARALDLVY